MNHRRLAFFVFMFFLNAGLSHAADYTMWVPYFPDELDGLKVTSKGDGMNMDMGGVKTSTLNVTYGSGERRISVAIMHSGSPDQVEAQKSLGKMTMETPEFIHKTITIEGFEAYFQNDKASRRVNITLFLKNNTMLIFEADGGKKENYYTGLVKKIDLKKIYATL